MRMHFYLTSIKLTIVLVSDPFGSFRDESASKIIALYLVNKAVMLHIKEKKESKIINKKERLGNVAVPICGY